MSAYKAIMAAQDAANQEFMARSKGSQEFTTPTQALEQAGYTGGAENPDFNKRGQKRIRGVGADKRERAYENSRRSSKTFLDNASKRRTELDGMTAVEKKVKADESRQKVKEQLNSGQSMKEGPMAKLVQERKKAEEEERRSKQNAMNSRASTNKWTSPQSQ